MELESKIDRIELKIRRLSSKLESVQEENKWLQKENKKLIAEKAEQKAKIGVLTDKLEETQRAFEQKEEGEVLEPAQLRKQLDQYISELDDVIVWLQTN